MLILILVGVAGLIAGLLLLRSVPLVPHSNHMNSHDLAITVIIPARNEAMNLRRPSQIAAKSWITLIGGVGRR